jgi:hypothetical protein
MKMGVPQGCLLAETASGRVQVLVQGRRMATNCRMVDLRPPDVRCRHQLAFHPATAQANLIGDGSFESIAGGFAEGWAVQFGQATYTPVIDMFGNCVGGSPNKCPYTKDGPMTISQSVSAVAGTTPKISAAHIIEHAIPNTAFAMRFNGVTLFSSSAWRTDWTTGATI